MSKNSAGSALGVLAGVRQHMQSHGELYKLALKADTQLSSGPPPVLAFPLESGGFAVMDEQGIICALYSASCLSAALFLEYHYPGALRIWCHAPDAEAHPLIQEIRATYKRWLDSNIIPRIRGEQRQRHASAQKRSSAKQAADDIFGDL